MAWIWKNGYALVFNTKEIIKIMEEDSKKFCYELFYD